MVLKYSRQRECIRKNLAGRHDHPTAEMVYSDVREELPRVSLGTVYRNLTLLAELGEARKLTVEGGADRFDGMPQPHYHFVCRKCGCVQNMPLPMVEDLNKKASKVFSGQVESHDIVFYGTCAECLFKEEN